MWICPLCQQRFVKANQAHSCGDKVLNDFLKNKSDHTVALFRHVVESFRELGPVTIHPTKSMIGLAGKTRFAYVVRLGRDFVDIVFPFHKPHPDNLCFHKIAQVPGQQQFNHHLHIQQKDDINAEVKKFMKLAYRDGS